MTEELKTRNPDMDELVLGEINFKEVVHGNKDLIITYNPVDREIHIEFEGKVIHAREVSITLTEHSGSIIKIRTQNPLFQQANGFNLISAQDIYIEDPSVFTSIRVLEPEEENGDSQS